MSYKSDRLAECQTETERLNVEAFIRRTGIQVPCSLGEEEDDPFVTLVDDITACVNRFLPYAKPGEIDDSGDLKDELLELVRTAAAQRLAELFGR